MSANELLTLVGLAWSRLAIDPGGLALLALLWCMIHAARASPGRRPQVAPADAGWWLFELSAVALPWLGLALLPAPAARSLSRSTDLVVVLALLEWPRIVAIARELRAPDPAIVQSGRRRLAAALNGYPLLILAALALAQAAGSLDIALLAQAPAAAPARLQALHWAGAAALTLALPLLLGCGPFRARDLDMPAVASPAGGLTLGLRVRACGLVLVAALPWLAPFGALETEGAYEWPALCAIVLMPVGLVGALWAFDRLARAQSPRRWAWGYLALCAIVLLALLGAAYAAVASPDSAR